MTAPSLEDQIRIALVQMVVEDGQTERNLERAMQMLAAAEPADVYLLPELWTTGYAHSVWKRAAEDHTARAVERLAAVAERRGGWVGGSLVSRGPAGKLSNRFWLLSPEGEVAATYDKAHLFGPMGETERMAAGNRRVRVGLGAWTASLSLCYDLRFPGMYRQDALDGADLFLVASEWPAERQRILDLLARARAAENQAYLALCNRTGRAADGTAFAGGSMVVDPSGEVLCRAGDQEDVVAATAHLSRVRALRREIPVLEGEKRESARG